MNLDKKRTVAEEEAAYLRTIIDPQLKDPSALQTMRVKELEKQLNETIQDYTTLQSKVSQWARSSKRNQEGRISAEAVQKVLEEENEALKAQLAGKGPDGASVIRAFSSVDESKRIKELQEQLANYERQADTEIDTLESKQVELLDTIEALRIKNQELQDVIGSQNEYQSIIKKRTSSLLPDRKLPTPVKNVGTLDINRKYKFLKDKFTLLEQEKNELLESEKILLKQLEVANKNYEKAMEKLEDQEEMQYAMKELETDKKTLQDAYNIALDKVQQKTLAIEMLQRNVDKTRDRMEPLQKSVEALDDLQDLLEQERYAKEELQDHIVSLEEDCKEQQKKILELMEQLGNKDTTTGVCNIHFFNFFKNIDMAEIEEFQKTIREYKSTIEVLNAQLGAKGKESINIHSQPNQEEELIALKSTVAEKLSIIEQFEELIAEDNQVIQELKAEKSNLTQSLANMEKMKQDFHKQRSEYEMLVEKVKKWESDSNSNITLMGNLQKNSDLDKFESELQSCQSKLNDVLLQKEEIQGHLLELKTKYLALEKENAFLIEQLENTGDVNAEPRLLQLEESLAEFSAQKEHLLSQLQSYHEMEEDYKDEVALRKDLEQKLNQIDSEMDFLQSEFDDKVQKINELQVELAGVRESSRGHELERETTISDLTDKSFDPSPIESNLLSKSQENLSSFITKLDAAEMEIEELRMQLAEKDTNATPGPHKVDTSVSPIKNHDDEKIENDFYQISLYETEIQEKQNEIGKLLGEIDHLEERLLQISEEKNDLERQSNRMVAEINAEHEVEIKRLESINSTSSPGAVKEVKELEKEIAFLKNQLSAKERSVSEKTLDSSLESEMKNLKLQIRDKTNMINNLEDQLKMLSHHNEVDDQCFSSKLDEAEQLLKKKESQIVELQAIIENSGLQNVTNDNEVESYKKQYADSLQQIEKLEETIVELRAKLDHHTGIAENALKQLDQYEYELLELRQRIANENSDSKEDQKLQNILKLRDSEVASLKSQVLALKDAKEEIEDLEMMNGQLLEKITFLSQQIAQQDNNRVSINPNAFAQKSLINSKNELEEVKQQLNEAILKIDAFQNEKADLLDELDDLRDHNMILTSQLNTINK